jgi:[ribosomal protein S5]-alanine N-acetyltransferase
VGELVRGPRIHLRHAGPEDREPFFRALRRSRSFLHPWVDTNDDDEKLTAWLAEADRDDVQRLFVARNRDAAIAGVFNLSQIFRGPFANAYLGYYALAPHQGKGYMHEGLELVTRYAFDDLGLHRMQANVQPANVRSIELLRKGGFRLEGASPRYLHIDGAWRDHLAWAITSEETAGPVPLATDGDVELHDVTSSNWRDVVGVRAREDQSRWVADIDHYLTLCRFGGMWNPLAITAGGRVVGFAMWGRDPADLSYWIGGFVIDRGCQRRGHGRAALRAIIQLLSTMPGCREIALSYRPDNVVAKALYASQGFVEHGEMDGDEAVARLPIRGRRPADASS